MPAINKINLIKEIRTAPSSSVMMPLKQAKMIADHLMQPGGILDGYITPGTPILLTQAQESVDKSLENRVAALERFIQNL